MCGMLVVKHDTAQIFITVCDKYMVACLWLEITNSIRLVLRSKSLYFSFLNHTLSNHMLAYY